jgi:hypothetical protein
MIPVTVRPAGRFGVPALAAVLVTLGGVALPAGCGGADGTSRCGPFPTAPADAARSWHVDGACPGEDDPDGSAAHPFATIGAALSAAEPGDAVLVAAGTYPEAVRVLAAPLAIVGPAEGAAAVEIRPPSPETGVLVLGPGGNPPEVVSLRGLRVVGATTAGIRVEGAAAVIEGCAVEDVRADAEGRFGYGILASGGARVTVRDSEVRAAAAVGVLFLDSDGEVIATRIEASGAGGVRAERSVGGVRIANATLLDNQLFGVGIFSAVAEIRDTTIEGTVVGAGGGADGVVVAALAVPGAAEAVVTVSGTTVLDSERVGILFGAGAGGEIVGNTARGSGWAGVWLQQAAGGAADVEVRDNEVTDNDFIGIGLTSGARATLRGNLVGATRKSRKMLGYDEVEMGDGVGVFEGALARVDGNRIAKSERLDIVIDAGAAGSEVVRNVAAEGTTGYEVVLQHLAAADDVTTDANAGATIRPIAPDETAYPFLARDFVLPGGAQ